MYYELYIDVFFLVNFMMDAMILGVSKKILKCPATYGSICLGALTGSLLTCAVTVISVPGNFMEFTICHGLISILMTKIGLRVKWNRNFARAYVTVYISAFLLGGIFTGFAQYMREASLFFAFAVLSYFIALGIWKFIVYAGRQQNDCCEVLLCQEERQIRIKAIIDTGNRLKDTVTGKPVSIISKSVAEKLWQDVPLKNLRYIPYHTIGKKEGVLPLLTLDRICLYQDDEVWVCKVLVAISEDQIGSGEFEMILNPFVR